MFCLFRGKNECFPFFFCRNACFLLPRLRYVMSDGDVCFFVVFTYKFMFFACSWVEIRVFCVPG